MAKIVSRSQWDVGYINLEDLYNPVHLVQTFGESCIARKQTATTVTAKLLSREYLKEVDGDSSVIQVLKRINPDQGVVLILDEAQRIGDFAATPDKIKVMSSLNVIHNGNLEKPVILLAAGLGTTFPSFGRLGISRFSEDCVVELGAL